MAKPNVFDRLRPLYRLLGPIEAAQVRHLGRSVLSTVFGADVVVLHTTGRRSGKPRHTTLASVERDGALLVVGGASGQTRLPDWVHNLRAAPLAAVTSGRRRFEVRAEELEADRRAQAWPDLVEVWPRIATYQRRAGRPIPVFRLTRIPSTSSTT